MDNINTILSKYKIVPRNFSIYEQALTHSSFSQNNDIKNYERLEFLGDAIINKVVAEHLFKTRPDWDENKMSKTRNMIVQSQTEVRAAKDMGLSESCIRIGNSIKKNDGITDKILEDVFEALIGAIYLDQGEKKAYKVIKNTIIHYFEINSLKGAIDYKTLLQEKTQALFKCRPKYHKKHSIDGQLMVEVWCGGKKIGHGYGENVKKAEFNGAKNAYNIILQNKKIKLN